LQRSHVNKVKASHTGCRSLGPELILVANPGVQAVSPQVTDYKSSTRR